MLGLKPHEGRVSQPWLENPSGLGYNRVSSVRFGGVRFSVYPKDHPPPHAHAYVGDGYVIIELTADRRVVVVARRDAIENAKASEVRKVLSLAVQHFDELTRLWEIVQT